ncbi:MAG: rhodanese-like domain-containing protein [Methylovulum miyakonense]|uniref:rhodanese-like domain-containing protein n=1 Tax=Methylovulum miyakonense TaxID=645578 RepID=UPI003BB5EC61
MKNSPKLLLTALLILAAPVTFAANHDAGHASQSKEAHPGDARPYTAKSPKLNRAQLDALLAKPEQLTIIDVRRPDEVSAIGGFPVYLSIQLNALEQSLAFIPKDRTIVTVSNHAGRAGKAADLLAEKGFHVARAVGSQNYEEEGGTISKIAPVAPKATDHKKKL